MKISLRGARANAGLTQQEVAKIMDVSTKTIQAWENGKTQPKPASVRMFAEVCNVGVDDIFLPTELT